MRLVGLAALVASAAFAPGAAAATGLSVSPLRLTLTGASSTTITVGNPSGRSLRVDVGLAGFGRTLRGRPRVRKLQGAAEWLRIRPRRFRLAPHAKKTLRLTAVPPSGAAPGDHPALLLLATRQPGERRVRVLLRVGVVVLVRVPGVIVRRLVPRALAVRRRGKFRVFAVRIANRGNVTERLGRPRIEILHGGKGIVTLRARRKLELLPHSAGLAEFVYRGRLSGRVIARIMRRSFRITL